MKFQKESDQAIRRGLRTLAKDTHLIHPNKTPDASTAVEEQIGKNTTTQAFSSSKRRVLSAEPLST